MSSRQLLQLTKQIDKDLYVFGLPSCQLLQLAQLMAQGKDFEKGRI